MDHRKQLRRETYIEVRAHKAFVLSLLQIRRDILTLRLETLLLELRKLTRVILLQVIHQLRHTSHIILLRLLVLQELRHQLTEIMQHHQILHLLRNIFHIRMKHLRYQLILRLKINIERLLRHTQFMAYIVYRHATYAQSEEHLSRRLYNMSPLFVTHTLVAKRRQKYYNYSIYTRKMETFFTFQVSIFPFAKSK